MQRSRTPLILLIIVLSLCIALACFAAAGGVLLYRILGAPRQTEAAQPVAAPVEPEPTATEEARAPAGAGVNRLLVVGGDGNIYTVHPDGSERIPLTTDASEDRMYRQPAWSPDGARVAWTEILNVEAAVASTAIAFARAEGGEVTRSPLAGFAPFYLAWSPDGSRLACLGSWTGGLALRTVDPAAPAEEPQMIGEGQPYYFAWSPDGARLLANVSGERLALVSSTGEETGLTAQPGVFNAPQWSADGKRVVFVERQGSAQRMDGQRLVVATPDGEVENALVDVEGSLTFALSPAGDRIAYVDTTVDAAMAAFGPLSVVDVESGEEETLAGEPVLAFFWSPDGKKLAYLTIGENPGDAPRASAAPSAPASHLDVWLQWQVWDGTESFELARFSPADTYLVDHLRFFDQYARSMTPWSPDSAAFTFAGMTDDGALGIWVQEAQPGGALERAGDGVYSAWSPR